jgi:hypothetical protein
MEKTLTLSGAHIEKDYQINQSKEFSILDALISAIRRVQFQYIIYRAKRSLKPDSKEYAELWANGGFSSKAEYDAWEKLSDEALINFESQLK